MRFRFILLLFSITMAITMPVASAAKPPAAAKTIAKSTYTPKQRTALDTVLKQLAILDTATQGTISQTDYKTKVDTAYHVLLIPFSDLSSIKNDTVTHATNAFQAYRDALTAWEEPVPYSEWDTIQDSVYVTPGIVKKYGISSDFLQGKQDLDVYALEDYAHHFINTAIWKYAHTEYVKALSGVKGPKN